MRFSLGSSLGYQLDQPTPFVFNLEVAACDQQKLISESLVFSPPLEPERFTAPETGNRYVRVVAPKGRFELEYRAEVHLVPVIQSPAGITEVEPASLPLETMPHINPSRFCQSDKLKRFAERQFGGFEPGHERVTAVCNWIRDNVDYVSGSTNELTSAFEIVTERAGVCRDFAHLSIALCRALGIPARYVSAYAWQLDPPDFHAVMECYLKGERGGRWYLFDATRMAALDGLVRIGIGRDAADVPFAAPFGPFKADKPDVWIKALDAGREGFTAEAISLSAT